MKPEAYMEWVSIYDDSLAETWDKERTEFRKITMLYSAFENELQRLRTTLNKEFNELRSDFRKKNFQSKRKSFKGLAHSEKFDFDTFGKENVSDNDSPTKLQTSPQEKITSPVLSKEKFFKAKRKLSSPLGNTPKMVKSSPIQPNDSNIMESSIIIEDTPVLNKVKKSKSLVKRKQQKPKLNKSKQANTLTQMFYESPKPRHVDSNLPSMTVSEMLKFINESSDSSETKPDLNESDETMDLDLLAASSYKSPEKKSETKTEKNAPIFEEVVRGKDRLKLKGWSCNECKDYYEALNLSPEEIQKKKDLCSRHRFKFKPRDETFEGFWDLTTDSPEKKPESQSLVFNLKK